MNTQDAQEELIEIAIASVETRGKTGPIVDFMLGQMMAGLEEE
jgi:hypothetical protein